MIYESKHLRLLIKPSVPNLIVEIKVVLGRTYITIDCDKLEVS